MENLIWYWNWNELEYAKHNVEADKSSKMDFLLFNYDSSFSTIVHKTNSLFFSD